jgi:large subunit ribosomal protein L23
MSILDRFSSTKGKSTKAAPKASKAAKAEEAKKEAFAKVSDGKEKAVAATPVAKESTGEAYRILVAPVVTEKSAMVGKESKYIFMIAPNATKMDVRNAVQHVYGVRPVAVNIVKMQGKVVRFGRYSGRQVGRKKAIVTLPAGKTIDVTNA